MAALLLLCVAVPAAQAHLLNMTKVQAEIAADGGVQVSMSIDLTREAGGSSHYYQLSRMAEPLQDPALSAVFRRLADAMQLEIDGQRVDLQVSAASLPQLPEAEFLDPLKWPMTSLSLSGRLPMAPTEGRHLQARFDPSFLFEEPIALTLQRQVDGRRMTRWLVAGQLSPDFALQGGGPTRAQSTQEQQVEAWTSALQYLRFGFEHILPKGLDHVLFVIGLYLGTRSLRQLLLMVTSFTVAHSLTLILASFGAVRVPAAIVEPAIAVSIAWIAMENLLWPNPGRWRPLVVFGFGLLHGLGFAAALSELGLPKAGFLGALVSFNVGVELGQLAVVAAALLVTGWFRGRSEYRKAIVVPVSLAIAALALLWTVQRLAG